MDAVSLNTPERLYVLHHDHFVSCLGFDVAERQRLALATHMQIAPANVAIGTREHYADLINLQTAASLEFSRTGRKCLADLTPQLIGLEGKRVEVTDKYGETRSFVVGRSTGWMPCHLELPTRNSGSGQAVSGAPFTSVRVIK